MPRKKTTAKKVTAKNEDVTQKPEEQEIDFVELLQIGDMTPEEQELGLREFRIRGIDKYIAEIQKTLDKEEKDALKKYLRMCPPINQLTKHLITEHPKSAVWFTDNLPKLQKKVAGYIAEKNEQ